jgi:predicted MPP superfamily phosphohydrolase
MPTPRGAQDRPARGDGTITRRALLKGVLATGAGALIGTSTYGFAYERHALGVTRADVPVTGLPDALSGLTIGLITDIHRSRWVSDDDVQQAVALVNAAKPDLVVLGGDYVTWGEREYVKPAAESLRGLTAPHGVFAILGNHDDDHDMPAALSAQGFTVLRDARTAISIRNENINMVGIRYWTRRINDVAAPAKMPRGTTLLLAHDPRRLQEAAALQIPLVLSGHTHGGQVVLPGIGAVAAQKFPVVQGIGRQGNSTVFVSRGVGTVYVPLRVNCPPEVAILKLRRT